MLFRSAELLIPDVANRLSRHLLAWISVRFQLEWNISGWDLLRKLLLQRLWKLGNPTTVSFLNGWIYLSWGRECVGREEQKVVRISTCSQENFCSAWSEVPILKFDIHSAVQNYQSVESEVLTDALNTSFITGPHKKMLHSNWNSHRFLYPCCTSHVEFLFLLGSASFRVPTPLNSDVTSSLPVARVTPITNILHFSLVSSAMWNAARGPNYPSIISESAHQAVSLS